MGSPRELKNHPLADTALARKFLRPVAPIFISLLTLAFCEHIEDDKQGALVGGKNAVGSSISWNDLADVFISLISATLLK